MSNREEAYVLRVMDSELSGELKDRPMKAGDYWQARAILEVARQLAIQNDRNERIATAAGLPAHPETADLQLFQSLNAIVDQLQIAYYRNPEAFIEFENEVAAPEFTAAWVRGKLLIEKVKGRLLPAHPETADPSSQHDPIKKELLAAIKTLLHWISPTHGVEEDPRKLSEVIHQVREVIARAEGR